jgi:hypothetical protein
MTVKRTYYLRAAAVAIVREMVEHRQLAPDQEALVEAPLADFFMAARCADEARQFAAAARDPELAAEIATLERTFRTADGEARAA